MNLTTEITAKEKEIATPKVAPKKIVAWRGRYVVVCGKHKKSIVHHEGDLIFDDFPGKHCDFCKCPTYECFRNEYCDLKIEQFDKIIYWVRYKAKVTIGNWKFVHELKCWTEVYLDVVYGRKTFEIRLNDRNYFVNNRLLLKEYNGQEGEYTGKEHRVIITGISKIKIEDAQRLVDGLDLKSLWSKEQLEEYDLVFMSIVDDYRSPNHLKKYCKFCHKLVREFKPDDPIHWRKSNKWWHTDPKECDGKEYGDRLCGDTTNIKELKSIEG